MKNLLFLIFIVCVGCGSAIMIPDVQINDAQTIPTDSGIQNTSDTFFVCPSTQTFCGGICVSVNSNTLNCGACGNICGGGTICLEGTCICFPGQITCQGLCTNTNTDSTNCGSCGTICEFGCTNGNCNEIPDSGLVVDSGSVADSNIILDVNTDSGIPDSGIVADSDMILPYIPTADLNLWLKADTINGLSDGMPVSSWVDNSMNNRIAISNVGSQPLYRTNMINGHPIVAFNGTSSYLTVESYPMFQTSSSEVTVFAVVQTSIFDTQRFVLTEQFSSCVNSFEVGFRTGNCDRANFGLHNGCSNAAVTLNNMLVGWSIYTIRVLNTGVSPNNVQIFVNSTQQILVNNGNYGGPGGYTTPGNYGTALNRLIIGGRRSETPLHPILPDQRPLDGVFLGNIAEIMIYSIALNDTDRVQVEHYLHVKYAL